VVAILPLAWLEAADENLDFWEAQQRTNAQLDPEGLCLTHLFRELEIILTPDRLSHRVRIPLNLARLAVLRPSTLDLILTKMARGDDNDLADIRFLLGQEDLTVDQLRSAFERARVPDVAEIRELFRGAQPKVLALADRSWENFRRHYRTLADRRLTDFGNFVASFFEDFVESRPVRTSHSVPATRKFKPLVQAGKTVVFQFGTL
jgi:hypothetical protein